MSISYSQNERIEFLKCFGQKIWVWSICVLGISTIPIFTASCVSWLEGKDIGLLIIPQGDLLIVSAAVAGDAIFDKAELVLMKSERALTFAAERRKQERLMQKLDGIILPLYAILAFEILLYTLVRDVSSVAEHREVAVAYISIAALFVTVTLNIVYRMIKEDYEWKK